MLVVLLTLILSTWCQPVIADVHFQLTVQVFDDASCMTPSRSPAINVASLPVAATTPDTCTASPPSLLANGFSVYTGSCYNSTNGPAYNLYLWINQSGNALCSQTSSSAFL